MFFSLNKKIIYTLAVFFLFTATVFIFTFYTVYGSKLQEEQRSTFMRNQQYIELLFENINLRKEISSIIEQNPQLKFSSEITTLLPKYQYTNSQQEELSQERKRANEVLQNYNERYEALHQAIKIVILSSILIILSMLLLWWLVKHLVVAPINKLSIVSQLVSSGNFSTRINISKKQTFIDEFDNLSQTFNQMLDNIEQGILEIKNKEAFLQSLVDSIPDGIRVIDENYDIIIANKEYYKQIGKKSSCIGCKCYTSSQNFHTPCPQSLYTCPLSEIKQNKTSKIKFIQQFAHDPSRHLSINAAPLHIHTQTENKTYIVEAIRDLSNDIRFSHQQKLSSLGFLATSVAHEMKNHLGSIRMILEAVISKYYRDIPDNNKQKQYLNLLDEQLTTCIQVPERLLKLSQISTDAPQQINIHNNIEDVISLLDYEAKRNGIDIKLSISPDNIELTGFDADFKMILINLIQNSFKAMPSGGTLNLKVTAKKKDVQILIQDTGTGIPAESLNHIFEPFYSNGKNAQNRGTGLGLSIVKTLVDKFHGKISVESKENKGTKFYVNLPLDTPKYSKPVKAPKKSLHKSK